MLIVTFAPNFPIMSFSGKFQGNFLIATNLGKKHHRKGYSNSHFIRRFRILPFIVAMMKGT